MEEKQWRDIGKWKCGKEGMEGKWRRNRGKKIRERKAWKTSGGGIEKDGKC